jgi:hypothetical protein
MIPAVPSLLLKAAPYAACAALGALAYNFTPFIGAHAQLARMAASRDAWKTSAATWKTTAGGWEASFRKAEGLRTAEQSTAAGALAEVNNQCDARVKLARASAVTIRRIVDVPVKSDPVGCPVRGVVDAGSLRDALQPAAATR